MPRDPLELLALESADDATWSVLGDHLLQAGDVLGELIQLEGHTDAEALARRDALRAPLERALVTLEWHRGVPTHARFDSGTDEDPDVGDRVLAAIAAFATNPAFRFVREVTLERSALSSRSIPFDAIEHLERATCAETLRALAILGMPWGRAGVRMLAEGPLLARLEALNLFDHGLGDEGAALLAASHAPRLATLHLASNMIGVDGATAIVASTRLRLLDLHNNRLGDHGMRVLALAGARPQLRELYLGMNRISDAGVGALAVAPLSRSLETLILGMNALGDDGVRALAGATLPELRHLDLSSAELTADAAEALAGSDLLGGLRELSLASNALGDRGVIALARSPRSANLEVLTLELVKGLGNDGLRALADSPYLSNLKALWLWTDNLQDGIDALLASPHLSPEVKTSIAQQHPRG